MYTITKQFAFEAAHHLTKVPDGHKCKRPHGHSYRIELELQSATLDVYGFVVDYTDLDIIKRWFDDTFDHRDLNEILLRRQNGLEPTAENLAWFIYDAWKVDFPQLTAVRVSETQKTWAEYRPDTGPNRPTEGWRS